MIHIFCQIANSLVYRFSDLRTYFDDVEEKIAGYITWQDSAKWISANLPRIEESHKDIVFREWEIFLKQIETTIFNVRDISNDLIAAISDNFFQENLI